MYSQIKSSIYGRSKPLLWYLKQPIYFSYSEKLQRNPFLKYLYIISQYTSDSIIHCNTPQTQHVDPHIFSGEWKRHKFLIRSFHQTPKIYDKKTRSMPRLLYMQNPLRWLTNKLDFGMLKRAWDPQFDESEFRRGTKQAVSTITKFVSSNMFANLKGLLTRPALVGLQQDVETKWSDEQRRLIALEPEDIQLAIPRKVHFQRIVGMFHFFSLF
ncbi:hypothetical protein C0J52_00831 [Blattella germanica]|nr:hypothetical protein C0J52_00831 [Blattella germanica]